MLCGCNVIDVHPYDCNIKGERDINRRNTIRIEQALVGKKEFTFAFISDTQRWYDQTEKAVSDINGREVDFVLHGGDLTDFGITMEVTPVFAKVLLFNLERAQSSAKVTSCNA